MSRGGARSRSGPAPDPNALVRQRDGKEWTRLPKAGRQAAAPAWPREISEPSVAEMDLWRRLWKTPQALVWEADGVEDSVALYVRLFLEAAEPGALASTRQQAKNLMADLLLTVPAMLSHRYVIIGTEEDRKIQEAIGKAPNGGTRGVSARHRFQSVPTGPDASREAKPPAVETAVEDESEPERPEGDEPPF